MATQGSNGAAAVGYLALASLQAWRSFRRDGSRASRGSHEIWLKSKTISSISIFKVVKSRCASRLTLSRWAFAGNAAHDKIRIHRGKRVMRGLELPGCREHRPACRSYPSQRTPL